MSKKSSGLFGLGVITGVIGGIIAGVLLAPKSGEESRKELKETVCKLYEDNSPAVCEAKKQAMESIDLMKYKLEKQIKKFTNMLKNRKMRKAKELEEAGNDYSY